MKILVADDSQSIVDLISVYLTQLGHQVIGVKNAELAIETFKLNRPDLIILDVLMPGMNGFECARKIRAFSEEEWIPIIFLSAVVDDKNVALGINAGGDDYLTKPISKLLLNAKITAMQRIANMRKKLFDITRELSILSITDPLTGVYNRLELDRIIKQKIERAKKDKTLVALFLLDLDNFKSINDNFGHYVGDLLLKEVANRLNQGLRKNDFLARMGGDEFAIVMSIEKIEDAELVANKIILSLGNNFELDGHTARANASFGIACYPFAGMDEKKLMQSADIAMYHAKSLGGSGFQYYTEALDEPRKIYTLIERRLGHALENNEFFIVYQPIFNLKTSRMTGMEVLIRWQNPENGLILPEVFIPIAEESSLINSIGDFVLHESCKQISLWYAAGNKDITYSINISPKQLLQRDFSTKLLEIITSYNLPPNIFDIEITETILIKNMQISEKIIKELHSYGFKISIDDFGTGYSSLVHLKQFPLSTLKIDKLFVRDIPKNENDNIIVSTLIALGKKLGLHVIAEGIENVEQLQFLVKNKCTFGQGFILCLPLSAEDMTLFLSKRSYKKSFLLSSLG